MYLKIITVILNKKNQIKYFKIFINQNENVEVR